VLSVVVRLEPLLSLPARPRAALLNRRLCDAKEFVLAELSRCFLEFSGLIALLCLMFSRLE
jgi:hypothetical protein